MSESKSGNGVSFLGLLFLVFLVLKLTHVIAWSWWLVTLPLWGGAAVLIAVLASIGVGAVIWQVIKALSKRRR